MNCPGELEILTYADGELPASDRPAFEAHLAECAPCRRRVAALRCENEILGEVLHAPEPTFTARGLVWTSLVVLAAATGVQAGLDALTRLNAQLGWLSPVSETTRVSLLFNLVSLLTREEVPMFFTIAATVTTVLLGCATFSFVARRRVAFAAAALVLLLLALSAPASATEFRHPAPGQGDVVVIPAGETIDDTVLATGREVVVEGTVTGNLIALGQRVRVPGEVRGSLVAAGRDVLIEGKIGGDVYSATQNLDLRGTVQGSVHGAGTDVEIDSGARVGRDVFLACEGARIAGSVGRDLRATGDVFTVSGEVTRAVKVHGHQLELTQSARVGGEVIAMLPNASLLRRAPGAQLAHEPQIKVETPARGRGHFHRWLTLGFYFRQLLRLAAAFGLGLVLYWLLPALFEWGAPPERRLLRSAGVGFLTLVATPIAAVLLCITVIGLPIGLLALMLWVVALYLSGIFVALMVGQLLLRSQQKNAGAFAAALLIGLALLRVGVNLPFLGGIVRFLVIIVGIGLLCYQLAWIASRLRAPAAA